MRNPLQIFQVMAKAKAIEEKKQLNFMVSGVLLEKIQAIADLEKVSYVEVYNTAFEKFVSLYEQKHGKIKPKPKGGGLKEL